MCQAANPGCILEDFVRWHSPPDWMETEGKEDFDTIDLSSTRGHLSSRMQKGGNHSSSSASILTFHSLFLHLSKDDTAYIHCSADLLCFLRK